MQSRRESSKVFTFGLEKFVLNQYHGGLKRGSFNISEALTDAARLAM